jgi:single-strand DNA-binding protein
MNNMLNRSILIGRLTRDPELRYTPGGVAVTKFTLAVNRNFKNKDGKQEADFINITTWRNLAENCANFLRKGSLICVDGRIQTGKYEKDGRTAYTFDVVAEDVRFLDTKSSQTNGKDPFHDAGQTIDISDDDLPF